MVPLVLLAALLAQERAPKFEDYPVKTIFTGVPVIPKLITPGQRRFRTMIREGAAKGPNFADHYAIAEWGCGAGCISMAVVDLQTGVVFKGPFEILEMGLLFAGANPRDLLGITYRRDSLLFVARGCPEYTNGGVYSYLWTGKQFKLLRKDPLPNAPKPQPH